MSRLISANKYFEDAVIQSFYDNTNDFAWYIEKLATKYYYDNKEFIKSAENKDIIDNFLHYITNNPSKIIEVLDLDLLATVDYDKIVSKFIEAATNKINYDNKLLFQFLDKFLNVSQKINNSE